MFYDTLFQLLTENKISKTQFYKDLNLANNSLTKWKEGHSPSLDTCIKIADYFNVSLDYMCGIDKQIPAEYIKIINNLRSLPKEYQEIIIKNISDFKKICNK